MLIKQKMDKRNSFAKVCQTVWQQSNKKAKEFLYEHTYDSISFIFAQANLTQKQKLLKALITDCKLNGSRLEYKLRKPFDKLLECSNYKLWPMVITKNLNEVEKIKI